MKTKNVLQIRGSWGLYSLLVGTFLAGCASSGTRPHDMSASQHQAAAAVEDQSASQHMEHYDSSQNTPCRTSIGEPTNCHSVQWRSDDNPTAFHRTEAEAHRKLAEKHRAASQNLRDTEQRFCSGISDADRDLSPFSHRQDIVAAQGVKKSAGAYGDVDGVKVVEIQQIEKDVLGAGGLQGARVTFQAAPGMTGEWLQRVVDCHLAQNAVIGNDPALNFCPLAVARATATVSSTGNGFAISITSDDANSVQEIIKRAWALGPSGPTVSR